MNKRKDYNMSYNTNIIGYSVRIEELFKEGNSKPTQIKVYAESAENLYSFGHWFTKTYEIKEPFINCVDEIMPKIKEDILKMERDLN